MAVFRRPRSKYGATPTVIDNIRFDSRREASRYVELTLMMRAGAQFSIIGSSCWVNRNAER